MITGTELEPWDVAAVPAAFGEISGLADAFGYLAAVFGSAVKGGRGRDLDVLMVSRFGQRQNWRGFLMAFGGEVVRQFHREDRGNHSYEVRRGGRLYHFIFGRF